MRPILLLLRLPPPYGGGEMLGAMLQSRLSGVPGYVISAMLNPGGDRATQGRLRWANVRFAIRRIRSARAAIRAHRPAVLYLVLPMNFAAFLWAAIVVVGASAAGVRVCGELAGMKFLFMESPWQRALGTWALRRLYSIRFLGEGIRRAHEPYRLRNPVVIPNGIEAPPAPPRTLEFARREPMDLLYVGALEESKGVGVLLDAAAIARDEGLPVRWTLVGEWASSAEFRRRAEERLRGTGLDSVVALPGRVAGDARWPFFGRAHVLVHPTRFDGQPLTILEAMSQGLAVISTRVGAIAETIVDGRNGILIDHPEPVAVVAAVRGLLADRVRLLEIMRCNREDFERRFAADLFIRRLREWLENVRDAPDGAGRVRP